MDKSDRIAVGIGLAFLGLLVLGVLLMLGGMMMMGDKFEDGEPSPSPSPTPTQKAIARDPAK